MHVCNMHVCYIFMTERENATAREKGDKCLQDCIFEEKMGPCVGESIYTWKYIDIGIYFRVLSTLVFWKRVLCVYLKRNHTHIHIPHGGHTHTYKQHQKCFGGGERGVGRLRVNECLCVFVWVHIYRWILSCPHRGPGHQRGEGPATMSLI